MESQTDQPSPLRDNDHAELQLANSPITQETQRMSRSLQRCPSSSKSSAIKTGIGSLSLSQKRKPRSLRKPKDPRKLALISKKPRKLDQRETAFFISYRFNILEDYILLKIGYKCTTENLQLALVLHRTVGGIEKRLEKLRKLSLESVQKIYDFVDGMQGSSRKFRAVLKNDLAKIEIFQSDRPFFLDRRIWNYPCLTTLLEKLEPRNFKDCEAKVDKIAEKRGPIMDDGNVFIPKTVKIPRKISSEEINEEYALREIRILLACTSNLAKLKLDMWTGYIGAVRSVNHKKFLSLLLEHKGELTKVKYEEYLDSSKNKPEELVTQFK